jgi:hypothetical protein
VKKKIRHLSIRLYAAIVTVSVWFMTGEVLAAGGGKPVEKIFNVADTRNMTAGLSKWIADIYNSNLWLYSLVVVVSMALIGLALGYGFDRLVSMTGIDLSKLSHHE